MLSSSTWIDWHCLALYTMPNGWPSPVVAFWPAPHHCTVATFYSRSIWSSCSAMKDVQSLVLCPQNLFICSKTHWMLTATSLLLTTLNIFSDQPCWWIVSWISVYENSVQLFCQGLQCPFTLCPYIWLRRLSAFLLFPSVLLSAI